MHQAGGFLSCLHGSELKIVVSLLQLLFLSCLRGSELWMIVGAFVLMGLFVLKMIYSDGSQKMLNGTLGTAPVAATVHPVKNISDKELQAKIDLCVKQFGWTADQCKQAYDPKTEQARNQHLEQSTGNHIDQVVFKYNASKPFENTYEVNAQPVDFPKFAGCMKKNGRYVAYTQQGTILKDVSASDCQRVIENGDRPFDYFKQPNQVGSLPYRQLRNYGAKLASVYYCSLPYRQLRKINDI